MIANKSRWIGKWYGIFLRYILLASLPLLHGCDGSIDIDFDNGSNIYINLDDIGEKVADSEKNHNNSLLSKIWIENILGINRGK
jgi:hypothetical protein